ncbi:MAG: assimilatory sulfite reductase (NADPH) flavoprotein subunit [Gammaproteobacteria bacterium]
MHTTLPDRSQTPLSDDQHRMLLQLLESLTPEQIAWAGGYLTGLAAHSAATGGNGSAAEITTLVGSQTGNCEALAEQFQTLAAAHGVRTSVKNMADYKLPQLKTEKNILVIVSTYGEGEPPDNAREMYDFLFSKRAPALTEVHFAVLGLGDSSYEFFCQTGVDFDRRFEELGAIRIHPRIDCDIDYEADAEAWMDAVLEKLVERLDIRRQGATGVQPSLPSIAASVYSRKHPFPAALLEDIVLNGRGSSKETHHVELSLEGSGLNYEPGDALGVYPTNAPDVIEDLLKSLNFNDEDAVNVDGREGSIFEALFRHYEITTLTRPMLQKYAALAKNPELERLLDENGKPELNSYLYGREIIDLITDFPCPGLLPQDFVDCLRKMPPRLYSIASSLKQHPDEVHLTVATVRYRSHGRDRKGVCSTFLADRIGEAATIPVYVDHNKNFKLPTDHSAPVIMIGPGTGIAPFRSFIEEREAIGATGKNWLFFGDQHFMTDFLYQAEWLRYLKSGVLTRMNVAFSRDQERKIYVQHRMAEQGRDLYAWLQEGAHLYVCGDEKRMAHDVHATLLEVIASEGDMTPERAEEFLKTLQKNKRYQRDIY